MNQYFDQLEIRSADQRAADLARDLPQQIARAQATPGMGRTLAGVDAGAITSAAALAALPVLRKSELVAAQAEAGSVEAVHALLNWLQDLNWPGAGGIVTTSVSPLQG